MATFDLPESPGPARDALLLAHAKAGELEVSWAPLTLSGGGHSIVLQVTRDALKLGGVRFGAGAGLAQQIADVIGALLPTPKILDAMYAQRAVTVRPLPLGGSPHMMDSSWFRKHSASIDAELQRLGYSGTGIVQSVGKPWMLSNELLAHGGRGENYGWHVPPGPNGESPNPWLGVATMRSVTLPKIRVLQDPGWAHGLDQADYSETVQLVHRQATVDGKPTDTASIYTDPVLSALVSHEGALKITRQPGVPLACAAPGPKVAFAMDATCPAPPAPPASSSSWWPWAVGGTILVAGSALAWRLSRARLLHAGRGR